MISQGTDEVSRGSLKAGVCVGKHMLYLCPLVKSCMEAEPELKPGMKSWLLKDTIFLTHKDCLVRGHDAVGGTVDPKGIWKLVLQCGVYVWIPPPAAAEVCLEELRKARMKQKTSMHVVVIEKLFTPMWLKRLNKAADCIFIIPATHKI